LISAGGHTLASGTKAAPNGEADAIAWARQFIANPHLAERFAKKCAAQSLRPRDILWRHRKELYRLSVPRSNRMNFSPGFMSHAPPLFGLDWGAMIFSLLAL
jgi:2,4-dienoyl-CoA reductase-like NADH-dependent reductase (Old Yellow Enzyme family)